MKPTYLMDLFIESVWNPICLFIFSCVSFISGFFNVSWIKVWGTWGKKLAVWLPLPQFTLSALHTTYCRWKFSFSFCFVFCTMTQNPTNNHKTTCKFESNYYQKATDTHWTGFFFAVACFAEFVIQPCLCKIT